MYSVEEIKENYKYFSDSKIENIARSESKGLRKEIIGIIRDEIKRRNLDESLITWVNAETDTLTHFEKQSLVKKIENLNCPNCGQKKSDLSGQEFNMIVSVLIGYHQSSRNRILCYHCGRKKRIVSNLTTAVAGWWSVKGILLTPYILINEAINIFFRKKTSDRIIAEFIVENNGVFRLLGTENEFLLNLITYYNNDYEIVETTEASG